MPDIKTREAMHGTIKAIDRTAIVSDHMKRAFFRVKESGVQQNVTPEEYAADHATGALEAGQSTALCLARNHLHRTVFSHERRDIQQIRNKLLKKRPRRGIFSSSQTLAAEVKTGMSTIREHSIVRTTSPAFRAADGIPSTASKQLLQTRFISHRAKITAAHLRRAATAAANAVRASATAKWMTVLLSAGGGITIAVILIFCMTGMLAESSFGIFFDISPTGQGASIRQAVELLNAEYRAAFETVIATVPHTRIELETDDVSVHWEQVLAVFSSLSTGTNDGSSVICLDNVQLELLRHIMWAMNRLDYDTREESRTVETSKTDLYGNTVIITETITETILHIRINHKNSWEMADEYQFNVKQRKSLSQMLAPRYASLWAQLLGGFIAVSGETIVPNTNWSGTGIFQWPLPENFLITSPFGLREDPFSHEITDHSGTDISAPHGTPILSAADGIVTIANSMDSWGGGYGYYIKVSHDSGLDTLYAHCSAICVITGNAVRKGEVIGYVGSTGQSTGSHLHFEVWEEGSRVDAMGFFTPH